MLDARDDLAALSVALVVDADGAEDCVSRRADEELLLASEISSTSTSIGGSSGAVEQGGEGLACELRAAGLALLHIEAEESGAALHDP